jgi:hypothetical protein
VSTEAALRSQLNRQLAHWRAAVTTIDDADNFASPEAWARVEQYLNVELRKQLQGAVARLRAEVNGLAAQLASAQTVEQLQLVRVRLLAVRRFYVAVETTLDFYGDAVNTRTNPKLASILRTLDLVAMRSMDAVLQPLGHQTPSVLTYIDKGLGASILRAGLRLWDGGTISPAAAIKMTRHNLYRPTSLVHETGHQVAHIIGWVDEFASLLRHELAAHAPPEIVEGWAATASEVVADIYAFVHCGYGAVASLHDVVASEEDAVLRYIPGDPHPIPYIRVLLNVEFCRRMYGAGPWDDLATAWTQVHSLARAAPGTRAFLERSTELLPRIADLALMRRMRTFGARTITELVDPARVHPHVLTQWSQQLGTAIETSMHWANAEPIRIVALSSYEMAAHPERATQIAERYEAWAGRVGTAVRAA